MRRAAAYAAPTLIELKPEPFAGVLGALLVSQMKPLLPYALAFAAGAMVYVVVDDIIPEAQTWCVPCIHLSLINTKIVLFSSGNGKVASATCMVGFLVMMSLDVGLG